MKFCLYHPILHRVETAADCPILGRTPQELVENAREWGFNLGEPYQDARTHEWLVNYNGFVAGTAQEVTGVWAYEIRHHQ
jgi:hypothetical protein